MSMRQSSFWCGTVKCGGGAELEHTMDPGCEAAIFKQLLTCFNCLSLMNYAEKNQLYHQLALILNNVFYRVRK
jgi:hypothetical protein